MEIGRALEELERAEAKKRQAQHGGTAPGKGKNTGGTVPPVSEIGKTRDKVGEALGVSGKTFERMKQVSQMRHLPRCPSPVPVQVLPG